MPDERDARLALNLVVEPADPRLGTLLASHTAPEVWRKIEQGRGAPEWVARAANLDLAGRMALARRHGLRFVVPGDDEWPTQLHVLDTCGMVADLGGGPVGLWVAGERPLAEATGGALAIVGARAATAYGERVASDWAAELAGQGTTILSGGAYGIDAAAHRGALAESGCTVAVMAGGLDEFYPRAHTGLLSRVREAGLLVSEYPPGEHPTRRRFLARNRLIAALTAATVVVEAAVRSGALNTTAWANACNRPVGAVPGPVSSALSFSTHKLIREHRATLVASVAQVRDLVAPLGVDVDPTPEQPRLLDVLTPVEQAVYEALPSRGGRDTGDLALRAGVSIPQALAALGALTEQRWVVMRPDGRWGLGPLENGPARQERRA